MDIVKSIIAGIAGIVVGAALSIGMDKLLETTGVLPGTHLHVASWLIGVVILYRLVFTVLGCYVTAKLAPHHPMNHAITVGLLGAFVAALGAYVTRTMNLGPQWYAWTLAVLTISTGWIGGTLAKK